MKTILPLRSYCISNDLRRCLLAFEGSVTDFVVNARTKRFHTDRFTMTKKAEQSKERKTAEFIQRKRKNNSLSPSKISAAQRTQKERIKDRPGIIIHDNRSPAAVADTMQKTLSKAIEERKERHRHIDSHGSPNFRNFDVKDEDLIRKIGLITNRTRFVQTVKLNVTEKELAPGYETGPHSFEKLGVHPKLIENLNNQNITKPTEIQWLTIKALAHDLSVVIHAETGSGKTLAYLLPMLEDPGPACSNIIVVPSRELALQIYNIAKSLLSNKAIVQVYVSGIDDEDSLLARFRNSIPKILIGTPKALLKIITENEERFGNVSRIVMDEADKIIPSKVAIKRKRKSQQGHQHFKAYELIFAIIRTLNTRPIQYIASTATVTGSLLCDLGPLGWREGTTVIKTKKVEGAPYQLPACLDHYYTVMPAEKGTGKVSSVMRLFRGLQCRSALVFVKSASSPGTFASRIRSLGINVASLHEELSGTSYERRCFIRDLRNGHIKMAVATEDIVRGLDLPDLDHVILTDVPETAADYVHLAGRVGRQDRAGIVSTVVSASNPEELQRFIAIAKELRIKVTLLS